MGFEFATIKSHFKNKDEIFKFRYASAKIVFAIFCLGFFISYYLIANRIFDGTLIKFMPFLYFGLVISLFVFVFYIFMSLFPKKPTVLMIITLVVVLIVIIVFSIPVFSTISSNNSKKTSNNNGNSTSQITNFKQINS